MYMSITNHNFTATFLNDPKYQLVFGNIGEMMTGNDIEIRCKNVLDAQSHFSKIEDPGVTSLTVITRSAKIDIRKVTSTSSGVDQIMGGGIPVTIHIPGERGIFYGAWNGSLFVIRFRVDRHGHIHSPPYNMKWGGAFGVDLGQRYQLMEQNEYTISLKLASLEDRPFWVLENARELTRVRLSRFAEFCDSINHQVPLHLNKRAIWTNDLEKLMFESAFHEYRVTV